MTAKLSVLMPCYNVADTLERALESILMQKVDFSYEIIAVDDASTDETLSLLKKYASKHPFIRVLEHKINQGNAVAFYDALSSACGDYFCVLDGDDYYTLPNKFQKQVDFLDADIKHEYVGCCHYFVIDLGNEHVSVPDCCAFDEFNYTDFLTQRAGYFHTTTHMYRNIFRGNVPEYFRQKLYRGDTPRTTFHLMFSGGKIKILPFVASAYVYTYSGIWSGMEQNKQFEYQINYLTHHKESVTTPFEKSAVDRLRDRNENLLKTAKNDKRRYPEKTIEECLMRAFRYAQIYAFREKDYFLKGAYSSEYIDSLCASLGVVHRISHPEHVQKETSPKHLAIMIWQLNPKGGGLFREVSELIQIHAGWKVCVIVTDRNSNIDQAQEIWKDQENVELCKVPQDCQDALSFLSEVFCSFQPEKLYTYCSHVDVFGVAALQPGVCRNICLYSYDHGYLTGLKNPFIDKLIAKRPVDYTLLTHQFGKERVLYIPTWNIVNVHTDKKYEPFCGHNQLITASGAARFYKVDGGWLYRYEDYIVSLLKQTGGVHYHFGDIPDERLEEIYQHLDKEGVSREKFIHIAWADDLPGMVLEKHVDIFIEPFPTVSYKMTLDMLSHGIPVIAHDAIRRMEVCDFLYPGALRWRSEEQFVELLSQLTAEELKKQSTLAIAYFTSTHAVEVIAPCLLEERSLCVPEPWYITDPNIIDISTQQRLFEDCCRVQIMSNVPLHVVPQNQKNGAPQSSKNGAPTEKQVQKALYAQAAEIRKSRTYRLGYAVLYIPRIVKYFLKTLKNKGFKAAFDETFQKDALTLRFSDAQMEVDYYRSCTCVKVGRLLSLPYRAIRKVYRSVHAWVIPTPYAQTEAGKHLQRIEKQIQSLAGEAAYVNKRLDRTSYFTKSTDERLNQMEKDLTTAQSQIALLGQQADNVQAELANIHAKMQNQFEVFNAQIIAPLEQQAGIVQAELAKVHAEMQSKEEQQQALADGYNAISEALQDQLEVFNAQMEEGKKTTAESKSMLLETKRLVSKSNQAIIHSTAKLLKRTSIEHLDYHLTEHCNLNCKGCSTFSPIAGEKFADASMFDNDLKRLHDLIGDRLDRLHLLGGEPLLHPQIEMFAKISRTIFPKAKIDFTTNGILVMNMPESFWHTLHEFDIAIKFTKYPIKMDYDKIIQFVQSKGVEIYTAGGDKPISVFRRIPMNTKGTFNIHQSYIQCPYTDCAQLRDGKIYRCPAAAYSDLLNSAMKEQQVNGIFMLSKEDYVDLDEVQTADEIFEFLSHAVPFCRYCDMDHKIDTPWETSKRDIREWVDED